jgi:hypothetical protein
VHDVRPRPRGGAHDVLGPQDVDLLEHRAAGVPRRHREVLDHLAALGRHRHRVRVGEVAAGDLNSRCLERRRVGARPGQRPDAVPVRGQGQRQPAADEARGPGDQDPHPRCHRVWRATARSPQRSAGCRSRRTRDDS